MASSFAVPNSVSFADAIALTQSLLDQIGQHQVDDGTIGATVRSLVSSTDGARGFFVAYLSGDSPVADTPLPVIVQALQTAPAIVSPLLVKNLAMSTAMAITHQRNQDETMAQGSDRVRSRTVQLIQCLQMPPLQAEARQLATSITTGEGTYQPFLDRWGYDPEQRQAILAVMMQAGLVEPLT